MTQADARNAVQNIHDRLSEMFEKSDDPDYQEEIASHFHSILYDLRELARQLSDRKPATPNCRPVTAAELQHLCASSNVVIFNPAA